MLLATGPPGLSVAGRPFFALKANLIRIEIALYDPASDRAAPLLEVDFAACCRGPARSRRARPGLRHAGTARPARARSQHAAAAGLPRRRWRAGGVRRAEHRGQ